MLHVLFGGIRKSPPNTWPLLTHKHYLWQCSGTLEAKIMTSDSHRVSSTQPSQGKLEVRVEFLNHGPLQARLFGT